MMKDAIDLARYMLAIALALLPWASALAACDLEVPTRGCDLARLDRTLHMNELQAIGTHNSYKQAMPPAELAAHRARDPAAPTASTTVIARSVEQLDRGARTLELDVYYDPHGGYYAHPPGALRKGYTSSPWSPTATRQMQQPGFKVMHSGGHRFPQQLPDLRRLPHDHPHWSHAHPRHVPIMLLINAKDGRSGPGAVTPLRFTEAAFDALDAEIRTVLSPSDLITPDDVQGDYPTLRAAVRAGHWPTLGAARGKEFFVLDEDPPKVALLSRRTAHAGRAG